MEPHFEFGPAWGLGLTGWGLGAVAWGLRLRAEEVFGQALNLGLPWAGLGWLGWLGWGAGGCGLRAGGMVAGAGAGAGCGLQGGLGAGAGAWALETV